jgi:hypothetical protein
MDVDQNNYPQQEYGLPQYPQQVLQNDQGTANLVQQINPMNELDGLEHLFRGMVWDDKNQKFVKKYGQLMNNKGVSFVMAELHSVVTQNTSLSNLDEKEVSNLIIDLATNLNLSLRANWKNFEMQKTNISLVARMAKRMAFLTLKRGYMAGEKSFIKTAHRSTEQLVVTRQSQSGGLRGKIAGILK